LEELEYFENNKDMICAYYEGDIEFFLDDIDARIKKCWDSESGLSWTSMAHHAFLQINAIRKEVLGED
jgi:hypothetical protein